MHRGAIRAEFGHLEAAIEEWESGLKANPEQPALHYNLAVLYLEDRPDRALARRHARRFLDLARQKPPWRNAVDDLHRRIELTN